MNPLVQRFRAVVAMWILVGSGGFLLTAFLGLALLTQTGPFAAASTFSAAAEFAPGAEIKVRDTGVRPGNILILATPAGVDPAIVRCTAKSRVYSTGEQRSREVAGARPEGTAAVMRDSGDPRLFTPVLATEGITWMDTDFVSCTGDGVEAFTLASAKGLQSDRFRLGAGLLLMLLAPVFAGLGGLALYLTRKWNREAALRGASTSWPYR
ncbi:hypothetical protein AB0893_02695 [Micromonospora aurantiaca]|uniref:hypothetical protein n=1 Tax=Micromonospora aurantiaca (nom. illeg.) TaxID=47850 RepID=UPI0034551560